jgi:pSer/pThr/pTyr-binding forkhead associated (FHA) protein
MSSAEEASTEALEPLGDGVESVDFQTPSTGAALVVASGHQAGTRYAITSELVTVGRHPDSDVFLDDITVSRRHVELSTSNTGHVIRDVGSLNGTYLNGERLGDSEVSLTNGDELQIGKFKLLYLVSSST